MKVLQVKEYNTQAECRYNKAIEEYKKGERQHYPHKPFYLFYLPDGVTLRKKGYVLSTNNNNSNEFFLTKNKLYMSGKEITLFRA